MKSSILTACLSLAFGAAAMAQPFSENPDVLPQYPDGTAGLFRFINEKMTWSETDKAGAIEGEMIVTFTVQADGKLSAIEIKKGLSPAINGKIVEVLALMPPWRPARDDGNWVSARYSLAMVVEAGKQLARPFF
jgi:protein TonB